MDELCHTLLRGHQYSVAKLYASSCAHWPPPGGSASANSKTCLPNGCTANGNNGWPKPQSARSGIAGGCARGCSVDDAAGSGEVGGATTTSSCCALAANCSRSSFNASRRINSMRIGRPLPRPLLRPLGPAPWPSMCLCQRPFHQRRAARSYEEAWPLKQKRLRTRLTLCTERNASHHLHLTLASLMPTRMYGHISSHALRHAHAVGDTLCASLGVRTQCTCIDKKRHPLICDVLSRACTGFGKCHTEANRRHDKAA